MIRDEQFSIVDFVYYFIFDFNSKADVLMLFLHTEFMVEISYYVYYFIGL